MSAKKREKELRDCFAHLDEHQLAIIEPTIKQVVFLEEQLRALKAVPHIKVHPTKPSIQKITPAGRLYKDSYNAYIAGVKFLLSVLKNNDIEEESPLRKWVENNGLNNIQE